MVGGGPMERKLRTGITYAYAVRDEVECSPGERLTNVKGAGKRTKR